MVKKKQPTKNAKTAAAKPPKQVMTAPSSPQPPVSDTRPVTRSEVTQSENEAANGENVGEIDATSSNEGNGPNPNRPRTRTANTHQHPGELHNIYTGKRRTKEEMLEARRIDAIKKATKTEEAERQAMEREDSVRRIAQYEEGLGQMNVDDTPIIRNLRRTYALLDIPGVDSAQNGVNNMPTDMEATPVPKGRGRQRPNTVEPMEIDFAEGGDEDGIAAPLESEATNQNDDDYVAEEDDEQDSEEDDEEDSEEDEVDEKGKCGAAKAGKKRKQGPKRATRNLKADEGDDEDTRLKKKAKGVTKGLVPEEKMKEGVELKKKKVKPGVLLRDAVAALRSEQNRIIDSATRGDNPTRGDKPKGYVFSHPPC